MSEKRTSSTAQRIQRLQTRRTKWVLFLVDLLLLLLTVGCWCYMQESAYAGEYNPFALLGVVERSLRFTGGGRGMFRVGYTMRAAGLDTVTADATGLVCILLLVIPVVLLVEGFIVWVTDLFAVQQVRSQLKPLYKLAQAAQQLSDDYSRPVVPALQASPGAADPAERFHTLESAIESIQPGRPDAGLHTGDKDLRGIEDAINSLLRRTRESYSQQIRFVSDASHELRTPIAVIKGYTDMLDRWGKKDEKVLEESIDAIKAETEHMNRLVEQLLFLARGDSGRIQMNMTRFSLCDLIREVYEESSMIDSAHRWQMQARSEVIAYGDAAMLKQAVRVLVDNAAKYTPEGETIRLRAAVDADGAPVVVVQDSGSGIAGKDLEHVFERFYRSDPARARSGGTGLGLAIAKWIVDRHGGYFDLLSREGIGTRVTIHLPAVPADKAAGQPGAGDEPGV